MSRLLISTLCRYAEPELPRCPRLMVFQELLNAARDFCRDTQVWRCETDPISLVEDVKDYDLDRSGLTEVDMLDWAKINDVELAPQSQYTLIDGRTIHLVNAPAADDEGALVAKVVLKPRLGLCEDAAVLPADVIERFGVQIAMGCMARLMAQMNGQDPKPWTNGPKSTFYAKLFTEATMLGRSHVLKDGTNVSLLMQAPPAHVFR